MESTEQTIGIPAELGKSVCGHTDVNLHKTERTLQVTITECDGNVKAMGEKGKVQKAISMFTSLIALTRHDEAISEQTVNYALSLSFTENEEKMLEVDREMIYRTASGRPVKPKTLGQKACVGSIARRIIIFGIGPADTGKTYLAMTVTVHVFRDGGYKRIILACPAVEAGRKPSFLPDDLQSKINPYLRSLYDTLYQIIGAESYLHNAEKRPIEVAPLTYIRDRTLDNVYVILDETQNTTPAQIKMFLTRIDFGSEAIITSDLTQKDLPTNTVSGLDTVSRVFSDIEGISFCRLTSYDTVQYPLIQQVVDACEKYEEKENAEKRRRIVYQREKRGVHARKEKG